MSENDRIVFGGVDTHRDTHVAAVVDATGRVLSSAPFRADVPGYEQLGDWLGSWGRVAQVGIEGTGSYGAGLSRHLISIGVEVAEVNRPNRQLRRRFGKTDATDAQAAARAVLSGQATGLPKSGNGPVEAIRMLTVVRRSATKARTQTINQLHALVVTAPDQVKHQLGGLSPKARIKVCAAFRPGQPRPLSPMPRKRCVYWPADTRHSPQRSNNSTPKSDHSAPGSTRRCSPPRVSALTRPPLCWSQQETTPNACAQKRPSPPYAAQVLSRRPRDLSCGTVSTAEATAKPTTPCGVSPPPACARTNQPSNTSKEGSRKAKPEKRSSAV